MQIQALSTVTVPQNSWASVVLSIKEDNIAILKNLGGLLKYGYKMPGLLKVLRN